MPLDTPAMILMVPVGAIVVSAALRSFLNPILSQRLPLKFGNEPRSSASLKDASFAFSLLNLITSSTTFNASSESYAIFIFISISANPMTPNPILRFAFVIDSISGNG